MPGSFRRVETESDFEVFKNIWLECCEEMEYESEPFFEKSQYYLILSKDEVPIGTVEFIPYNPEEFSTVEKYHSFKQDPRVASNKGFVYEMDKGSIKREHRRAGNLDTFYSVIEQHTKENNVKYYVGFMEYKLYRSMKFLLKDSVQAASEKWVWEEHTLIPIIVDVEVFLKNLTLLTKGRFSGSNGEKNEAANR